MCMWGEQISEREISEPVCERVELACEADLLEGSGWGCRLGVGGGGWGWGSGWGCPKQLVGEAGADLEHVFGEREGKQTTLELRPTRGDMSIERSILARRASSTAPAGDTTLLGFGFGFG